MMGRRFCLVAAVVACLAAGSFVHGVPVTYKMGGTGSQWDGDAAQGDAGAWYFKWAEPSDSDGNYGVLANPPSAGVNGWRGSTSGTGVWQTDNYPDLDNGHVKCGGRDGLLAFSVPAGHRLIALHGSTEKTREGGDGMDVSIAVQNPGGNDTVLASGSLGSALGSSWSFASSGLSVSAGREVYLRCNLKGTTSYDWANYDITAEIEPVAAFATASYKMGGTGSQWDGDAAQGDAGSWSFEWADTNDHDGDYAPLVSPPDGSGDPFGTDNWRGSASSGAWQVTGYPKLGDGGAYTYGKDSVLTFVVPNGQRLVGVRGYAEHAVAGGDGMDVAVALQSPIGNDTVLASGYLTSASLSRWDFDLGGLNVLPGQEAYLRFNRHNGDGYDKANYELELSLVSLLPLSLSIDLNGGGNDTAPGFVGFPLAAYTPQRGYGWDAVDSVMYTGERAGYGLEGTTGLDFHMCNTHDSTFKIDVPINDGRYDVTLHFKDAKYDHDFDVFIEGLPCLEGVQSAKAGPTGVYTFRTSVQDGQLSIRYANDVGGSWAYWVANAIEYAYVAPPSLPLPLEGGFDFNGGNDDTVPGLIGVCHEAYSPTYGYGWLDLDESHVLRLREKAGLEGTLAYDFHMSNVEDGTFVIDVPINDAVYDVTVYLKDRDYLHDFDVFLNGQLVLDDVVSATGSQPIGQYTFRTYVSDGQLQIRFHNDPGGSYAYWICNAIEYAYVPEPATMSLLVLGLLALARRRRR